MIRSRVARIALLLALAACSRPGDPASTPSDLPIVVRPPGAGVEYERVVLVTIDTLRADHVSCYGYARRTTPFLDSLAARGVRFTRAMAAVSHTAPSHATMLTGLVPAVHGVVQNGGRLAPEVATLPELFAGAGFETAAFLNVNFLSGIAASFGKVAVHSIEAEQRSLSGADLVDGVLGWLVLERQQPRFFLWVHLYAPHKWKDYALELVDQDGPLWSGTWTGTPPANFLAYLSDLHGLPAPSPGEPFRVSWKVERKGVEDFEANSAASFLRCVDAYDELTLQADRQIERLHRAIEALALPGRTLWVVTSDHGEGLASHGVAGHGARIYQEQLHVPLLLYASDGSLATRVVDELVGHVDLLPTLAETLGASVQGLAPLYEGHSLWPLARGAAGGPGPRQVFSQRRPAESANDPDQSEVYALQDGQRKLILHRPGTDQFYDLSRDPKELTDLGAGHADASALRAALEQRLRQYGELPTRSSAEVPEEWLEELRDLGYVR